MARDLRTILGGGLLEKPLMKQALTHRSAACSHNERIEFLGDAVLGVIIAEALYQRFPSFDEGALTKLRAHLVREETLAKLARVIDLPPLIVIGHGESESGGRKRDALLADTLEAVIGAVYLLEGMGRAADFVNELFDERLESTPSMEELKDSKTKLQEYLQARGRPLPVYEAGEKTGGTFCVVCKVIEPGVEFSSKATSKRKAEQQAAAGVLKQLQSAS